MAKRRKLASQASSLAPTNWNICALCQEHIGDLICPTEQGYSSLASNISSLHELNKVQLNINISRLNEGCGIEATLNKRKAKWHKSCYVLCNAAKVDRARKASLKGTEQGTTSSFSPVKIHHLRVKSAPLCDNGKSSSAQQICLFCQDSSGDLQKAETMSIDTKVRKMAEDLRDTRLIAKLSAGDMVAIDSVYHKKLLDCIL